jgi:DNA ligase 1
MSECRNSVTATETLSRRFSPMLAATLRTENDLPEFPLLATPKIDGIRALIVEGVLVSRTLRPIPNRRIRGILEPLLPEGADGEIFCGDLYTTTSTVMSFDAEGSFRFFWFDWTYGANVPYGQRASSIREYITVCKVGTAYVSPLLPHTLYNVVELRAYEEQAIKQGFEGIVLRIPNGRYKTGRSTLREGLMVKLKRYKDSEATIVAAEELVHGVGDKAGTAGGTLGSIVAMAPDGTVFKIGTGYTADQRSALWSSRSDIIGKAVKYRYADRGSKDKPRCPVFIGIRHEDDM